VRKLAVGPFAALQRYVSRELWITFSLLGAHGWSVAETTQLPHGDRAVADFLCRHAGGWPDVVLFWESYPALTRCASPLAGSGTRIYVMIDDLHRNHEAMDEALDAADVVLAAYAPRISEYRPRVESSRVIWMPHAAGPDFLMPVEESPSPVVFVSGAMAASYPLRLSMRALAERRPELAQLHAHPGYECSFDYSSDDRVGRGYALAIRECLAAFTDALSHQYIVAKHFEIPATGALLIADRAVAPQLAMLGFIDGEHYVSASNSDLEPIVEHVLDRRNSEEIDAIRRRGHALVHARHTTLHRAQQIDAVCV
jgi:hypothetical protein